MIFVMYTMQKKTIWKGITLLDASTMYLYEKRRIKPRCFEKIMDFSQRYLVSLYRTTTLSLPKNDKFVKSVDYSLLRVA